MTKRDRQTDRKANKKTSIDTQTVVQTVRQTIKDRETYRHNYADREKDNQRVAQRQRDRRVDGGRIIPSGTSDYPVTGRLRLITVWGAGCRYVGCHSNAVRRCHGNGNTSVCGRRTIICEVRLKFWTSSSAGQIESGTMLWLWRMEIALGGVWTIGRYRTPAIARLGDATNQCMEEGDWRGSKRDTYALTDRQTYRLTDRRMHVCVYIIIHV